MLALLSKIEKREGCIRVFRFDHLLSSEFEAKDGLDTRDSLGWGRLHYVALWNDFAKVCERERDRDRVGVYERESEREN